jgi:serine/threonine protein phosphatase PrpC
MKIAKIYISPSIRLKGMVAERRGWRITNDFRRLREDYFLQSSEFPIFAVADGVTLAIKPGKAYPVPSGAGEVAKIFCKGAIKHSENLYADFKIENILDIFAKANTEARNYNRKHGRTRKTINYFDIDYFCATAALAVVKNDELFYGTIGDSRITLKDKNGKTKFSTRDRVAPIERLAARKIKHPKPQEKKYFQQKYFRNKIGAKGELVGYGVINGEEEALRYVEYGKAKIQKGDQLFILSDGFTPYFRLPNFRKLFLKWSSGLEKKISDFTQAHVLDRLPHNAEKQYRFLYKYASERSLFAIKF